MIDSSTMTAIISVGIGFLLVLGSFASFMYKKPLKLTWTLFAIAVIFLTIIPLYLAVFVAAVH